MKDQLIDINIKMILENWTVPMALRELYANALDETVLCNLDSHPKITYQNNELKIIDFGRGIKTDDFVQNENLEKINSDNMIGKFGIGLKDSIAVLFRNNKRITIQSNKGIFTPVLNNKHGIDENIETIHISKKNSNGSFIGTTITINDISLDEYNEFTSFFTFFSPNLHKINSNYGDLILNLNKNISKIFYNDMQVSEDDGLIFSYNINKPNKKFLKSLNRERTFISRDGYSDSIVKIIKNLDKNDPYFLKVINSIYDSRNDNNNSEWNFIDVKEFVLKNIDKKIIIFNNNDNQNAVFESYAKDEGYELCYLNNKDYIALENRGIYTFNKFIYDFTSSYETQEIKQWDFNVEESNNWDDAIYYLKNLSLKWKKLKILFNKINFKVIEGHPSAKGITNGMQIEIVRKCLNNKNELISTLLHEICHVISESDDGTIEFESCLTECMGYMADY